MQARNSRQDDDDSTGVQYDSPLEGQSPWAFALITLGKARHGLSYLILF